MAKSLSDEDIAQGKEEIKQKIVFIEKDSSVSDEKAQENDEKNTKV